MKIKFRTKSKAKTTKQKKIDKEKKEYKLNSDYMDNSEFNLSNVSLTVNKLTYGIIRCCNVKSITIGEDVINIENSWVELLILLIDNLIDNYEDWRQRLIDNDVQSQTFQINEAYGKIDLRYKYEVYKIYDKDLYLEAVFSENNIYRALIGLMKASDIKPSQVSVYLSNKNFIETELNYEKVHKDEFIYNIHQVDDIINILNNKGHIMSVQIGDEIARVHSIIQLFGGFITSIKDREKELINKDTQEKHVSSVNNTGFVFEMTKGCMQVPESNIIVTTDGNEKDILEFIGRVSDKLELPIKLKIRQLSLEKKEWEVD